MTLKTAALIVSFIYIPVSAYIERAALYVAPQGSLVYFLSDVHMVHPTDTIQRNELLTIAAALQHNALFIVEDIQDAYITTICQTRTGESDYVLVQQSGKPIALENKTLYADLSTLPLLSLLVPQLMHQGQRVYNPEFRVYKDIDDIPLEAVISYATLAANTMHCYTTGDFSNYYTLALKRVYENQSTLQSYIKDSVDQDPLLTVGTAKNTVAKKESGTSLLFYVGPQLCDYTMPTEFDDILYMWDTELVDIRIVQQLEKALHNKVPVIVICVGTRHAHDIEALVQSISYPKIYVSESPDTQVPISIKEFFQTSSNAIAKTTMQVPNPLCRRVLTV